MTFSEMKQNVRHCTSGLRKLGIKRGDKVTIATEAGWEWITFNFANQFIGK